MGVPTKESPSIWSLKEGPDVLEALMWELALLTVPKMEICEATLTGI